VSPDSREKKCFIENGIVFVPNRVHGSCWTGKEYLLGYGLKNCLKDLASMFEKYKISNALIAVKLFQLNCTCIKMTKRGNVLYVEECFEAIRKGLL